MRLNCLRTKLIREYVADSRLVSRLNFLARGLHSAADCNLLPEPYLTMSIRTFESPDGATWSVWEVIPAQVSESRSAFGSHLPRELAAGWLCFDCGKEKRRLAPLPANWHERPEEELRFWCRAAVPVRARPRLRAAFEPVPASSESA